MTACSTRRTAHPHRGLRGSRAAALAGAVLVTLSLAAGPVTPSPPARADTAPLDPTDRSTPVTVSADSLPTVQIDGVALQQVVVGRTVFVVGGFSTARPAGARPGERTRPRRNILAYDLHTGLLSTTFKPSLNDTARTVAASPDGSRLYVGGDFTRVDGVRVNRVVALDARTGRRLGGFRAGANATVRAIVASGSRVWFGGSFNHVNGRPRWRLAAVTADTGRLLRWAPRAEGRVYALALSPTRRKVAVGGSFTRLNGSSRPGFGLGMVDARTGALRPFPVNRVVRNGGANSAIRALASDGRHLYGTGAKWGRGGNFEGAFSARWSDGSLRWIEDCHGDSLGVHPAGPAVYVVGHAHSCRNVGGFPETRPRTWHRALAFSTAATGKVAHEPGDKYHDFGGLPAPSLLHWFPSLDIGTYTGQNQGPWTVTGTRDYVAVGGEFRRVNNLRQQGLARFAVSELAPNLRGPRLYGKAVRPALTSPAPGVVKVVWRSNWDQDNARLTYRVHRDGDEVPVAEVTVTSTFWRRPTLRFRDTDLLPGTYSYRVAAVDPFGNVQWSPSATIDLP